MDAKGINVILTGATGMVGEGILIECLGNKHVQKVLMVNRKHVDFHHPKLSELVVNDFSQLAQFTAALSGFDACFYCAGKSSNGLNEAQYSAITYDATLAVAIVLHKLNPGLVFCFVSGSHTDSSEQGSVMWARVA